MPPKRVASASSRRLLSVAGVSPCHVGPVARCDFQQKLNCALLLILAMTYFRIHRLAAWHIPEERL